LGVKVVDFLSEEGNGFVGIQKLLCGGVYPFLKFGYFLYLLVEDAELVVGDAGSFRQVLSLIF
jgi:hypothetical protein